MVYSILIVWLFWSAAVGIGIGTKDAVQQYRFMRDVKTVRAIKQTVHNAPQRPQTPTDPCTMADKADYIKSLEYQIQAYTRLYAETKKLWYGEYDPYKKARLNVRLADIQNKIETINKRRIKAGG